MEPVPPKDKDEASEVPEATPRPSRKRGQREKSTTSQANAAVLGKDVLCRHAVFTLNSGDDEYPGLPDLSLCLHAEFAVFQEEIGETGRPHIQGYVQFAKQRKINGFTAELQKQGFFAVFTQCARGSDEENVAYCSKDEGRIGGPYWHNKDGRRAISGVKGGRNDILAVKKKMQKGEDLVDLAQQDESFPTIARNLRAFQWLAGFITPMRNTPTIAIVLWGSTGTGKSTTARLLAGYLSPKGYFPVAYQKNSGLYFDGYRQGQIPIFDEMDGSRCDPKFFNMLCDAGGMTVPIHGGSANFNSPFVVFTTNKHPSRWWPNAQTPGAVKRRMVILPVFVKHPTQLEARKQIKMLQLANGISQVPMMQSVADMFLQ